MGGVSHLTGDSPSFDVQQKDREWYVLSYDTTIGGRTALIDARDFSCMATARAENATVSAIATRIRKPPPASELCAMAIEFMKRAVPRMPPPAP
jgi:hypothetical protein